MNLDELIEELQRMRTQQGNLPVLELDLPGAYVETFSLMTSWYPRVINAVPRPSSLCPYRWDEQEDGKPCLVL